MDKLRVCFYGKSYMGTWKVRAQQISRLRDWWSCTNQFTKETVKTHDLFCFVKRADRRKMAILRQLGKVVVYDVLDCWKQPEDGECFDDLSKTLVFFEEYFRDLPADGVIFPNRAMMEDLGHLTARPIVIYHHFRPGLKSITVRETAKVVGYEGEESFLGPWRESIERACASLDLSFVVNPPSLDELDIGFAARGGRHLSFMSSRYKSNVKLANFYGAGLPCLVLGREQSYKETASPHVRFFETKEEMHRQLVELLPYSTRLQIHLSFLEVRHLFTVERTAGLFESYFQQFLAHPSLPRLMS